MSVVTFSHWVNYSRLIVTLPSPSYIAIRTGLLGFIDSGVTPPSSPVELNNRLELLSNDYKSLVLPTELTELLLTKIINKI